MVGKRIGMMLGGAVSRKLNNWKNEIMSAIPGILKRITDQGRIPPSLRGLFYILLDTKLIKEKSDNAYKTLSDELTQARLDPDYKKPAPYLIPLDALRHESRPSYENKPTQTPEQFVTEEIVSRIRKPEKYYIPPRWHQQKHFVIIVIEKSALFEDFLTIIELENLQVMLFPLGGYYGVTDYSHLYDILAYHQRHLGQSVHILYFGDYDGHGLAIDNDVTEKLEKIAFRYLTEGKTDWYLRTIPKRDGKTLESFPT
jgi:hypothetical protein